MVRRGGSDTHPLKHFVLTAILAVVMVCGALAAQSPTTTAWQRLILMQSTGMVGPNWAVSGDSHAAHLARLYAWMDRKHTIHAETNLAQRGLLGLSITTGSSTGWVVLIDHDKSANAKFVALAHELGHMYSPKALWNDGTVADRETFAELVAVQVADHAGLDVWTQTATYLNDKAPIENQMRTVQKWAADADRLVARLDKIVKPSKP